MPIMICTRTFICRGEQTELDTTGGFGHIVSELRNKREGSFNFVRCRNQEAVIASFLSYLRLPCTPQLIIAYRRQMEKYHGILKDIGVQSDDRINWYAVQAAMHEEALPTPGILRDIPAEYFINMPDDPITQAKYNHFRIHEILNVLFRFRAYLFNAGVDDEKVNEIYHTVYMNAMPPYQLIKNLSELEKPIQTMLQKYCGSTYDILFSELPAYMQAKTSRGYSEGCCIKYNYFLADYLKDIGFRIRY